MKKDFCWEGCGRGRDPNFFLLLLDASCFIKYQHLLISIDFARLRRLSLIKQCTQLVVVVVVVIVVVVFSHDLSYRLI